MNTMVPKVSANQVHEIQIINKKRGDIITPLLKKHKTNFIMKNSVKIFYFLLFVTFSCNIKQVNSADFKKFNVKGTQIFSDNVEITKLYFLDELLFAKIDNKNFYYALFDSKSLKFITRIARKGEGPNEIPYGLSYSGQYIKENDQVKIWTYGVNTHILYLINVTKSISEKKTVIEKQVKSLSELNFSNLFYLDSTRIIANNGMITPNMNRLQIYNPVTNNITKIVPLFPAIEIRKNIINMDYIFYRYNVLYISSFRMKPDKTKFASAMNFFNRVDIFDDWGNLKYSYIDKDNNNTKGIINDYLDASEENVKNIDIKEFYGNSVATDSFIYTLYRHQVNSEYGKVFKPITIRVFNWQAEPICEINVPDYLTSFTIDEKNGIMYGIAYFDEKILKYDISSILDEIKAESR